MPVRRQAGHLLEPEPDGRMARDHAAALEALGEHEVVRTRVAEDFENVEALREALPRETILSCDMSLFWADMLSIFPVYEPRTLLFPWGFGTLGFGLPEALGAKFGMPERPVVASAPPFCAICFSSTRRMLLGYRSALPP